MQTETVEARAQPMLYVRKTTAMAPEAIAPTMAQAFQKLGAFVGAHGIAVTGPPIAVYRDYDRGRVTMDVGVPVAAAALGQATGDIKAGATPSGKAMKIVHRGPYETLFETYAEIESAGINRSPFSWEVYPTDPSTTPADQLITEIFMPLQ